MFKYITSLLFASLFVATVQAQQHEPYVMPGTEVIPLPDKQSDRKYELYVKLPSSYHSAEGKNKHYPVIYYTDAVWHIDILSAAATYLMEDVILVGISWQLDIDEALRQERGAHVSRFRDYSISESTRPEIQKKYQFGQANKHLAFINGEVIRYVEKHYRTQPNNRTYFGYSMGGQFGLYALITKPDSFKNYIIGSPGMRNTSNDLTELVKAPLNYQLNANVFISYGDQEEQLSEHTELLINLLKSKKDNTLKVTRKVIEGTHQTAFPATGLESIKWLVARQK